MMNRDIVSQQIRHAIHRVNPLMVGIAFSIPTFAVADNTLEHSWQNARLFYLTARQVDNDKQGKVFIYDGVTDKQVKRAMDEQYDRIHAMMFTNVVVTDDNAQPLIDADTGEVEVEEDGC